MNTTITEKQVAIVTGASSGIGLGITQALLQHGYRVIANSCNISKSKDLKPSSDLILVDWDISKKDSHKSGRCRHQTL
jgi:NAD(P)-dependent dehydrogenase (short-subunit alcohol dehydrogenase family)